MELLPGGRGASLRAEGGLCWEPAPSKARFHRDCLVPPVSYPSALPMNKISAYLRILFGLGISIVCFIQNAKVQEGLQNGGTPQLFGHAVGLGRGQVYTVFIFLGVVGLILVLAGLVTLFKR